MSPLHFKQRFTAHILSNARLASTPELAELREELCEFANFDLALLAEEHVPMRSASFLANAGFPRSAAPFLDFDAHDQEQLRWLHGRCGIPDSVFPFGSNGAGDWIGIDTSDESIVCLDHARPEQRTFVNSTIAQLAECLCLYQEHQAIDSLRSLLPRISLLDPAAARVGSMWHNELHGL